MTTNSTTLSNFSGFLTPEISQDFFKEAQRHSVIQQLATQVPLSNTGVAVPVIASKPTANWVAEAGEKPVTSMGLGLKTLQPKKIACISVLSAEVLRANPGNFMYRLVEEIGEAFGKALDNAALHGTNSPFGADQHLAATDKTVALGTATQQKGGMFADINSALKLLTTDGKNLTALVFDDKIEADFNSTVDTTGRPLFIEPATTQSAAPIRDGKLLGRQTLISKGVAKDNIVGFAGDFSKALWGVVGGISYDVSTEATVKMNGELVSLWQHNLVAVRAEAEYGFLLDSKDHFVKFTM